MLWSSCVCTKEENSRRSDLEDITCGYLGVVTQPQAAPGGPSDVQEHSKNQLHNRESNLSRLI